MQKIGQKTRIVKYSVFGFDTHCYRQEITQGNFFLIGPIYWRIYSADFFYLFGCFPILAPFCKKCRFSRFDLSSHILVPNTLKFLEFLSGLKVSKNMNDCLLWRRIFFKESLLKNIFGFKPNVDIEFQSPK